MMLSAYLDGEVPERFVAEIDAELANEPSKRREFEVLLTLRDRLATDPTPDVETSARRSWDVINERLATGWKPQDVWHRRIAIPFPAFAAAATLVLVLGGVLLWSLLARPPRMRDFIAKGKDVDVTIRVDGNEMDQVLQWLVDQNMLGEVNIQLPEQQFQIIGEPVLVKPARYEGTGP